MKQFSWLHLTGGLAALAVLATIAHASAIGVVP